MRRTLSRYLVGLSVLLIAASVLLWAATLLTEQTFSTGDYTGWGTSKVALDTGATYSGAVPTGATYASVCDPYTRNGGCSLGRSDVPASSTGEYWIRQHIVFSGSYVQWAPVTVKTGCSPCVETGTFSIDSANHWITRTDAAFSTFDTTYNGVWMQLGGSGWANSSNNYAYVHVTSVDVANHRLVYDHACLATASSPGFGATYESDVTPCSQQGGNLTDETTRSSVVEYVSRTSGGAPHLSRFWSHASGDYATQVEYLTYQSGTTNVQFLAWARDGQGGPEMYAYASNYGDILMDGSGHGTATDKCVEVHMTMNTFDGGGICRTDGSYEVFVNGVKKTPVSGSTGTNVCFVYRSTQPFMGKIDVQSNQSQGNGTYPSNYIQKGSGYWNWWAITGIKITETRSTGGALDCTGGGGGKPTLSTSYGVTPR